MKTLEDIKSTLSRHRKDMSENFRVWRPGASFLGNRAGQYSVRINDQWRLCFEWRDGDAYEVEITDYH